MDTNKKYTASIAAIHSSGKGMILDHLPVRVEAESANEANEKALEIAKQRWPADEGWSGHSAVSLLR